MSTLFLTDFRPVTTSTMREFIGNLGLRPMESTILNGPQRPKASVLILTGVLPRIADGQGREGACTAKEAAKGRHVLQTVESQLRATGNSEVHSICTHHLFK